MSTNTSTPFTVFCREKTGYGTTWIGHLQADTADEAASLGRKLCAEDWSWDSPEDVHVLGVAVGVVYIALWND